MRRSNSGAHLAPAGTVVSHSRCHHAASILRNDANTPQRSGLHPEVQSLGAEIPERLGRTTAEKHASARADAKGFPAGCAHAYKSHHAPPWAERLPAGRRLFATPPVLTASLVLLRVPLAFSGALQSDKQGYGGWIAMTSEEAWLRDRKNLRLPGQRRAPKSLPSY